MSPSNIPVVIAIVEDHPIVIEGLQKILAKELHIEKVYEFTTGDAFITELKSHRRTFQIVLLDITLPDSNGVDLCREIKALDPDTTVLGFSNHSDRSLILQMLSNGASGYILKNASASEISQCIREAMSGQIAFSNQVRQIMARPSTHQLKNFPSLTKREKQVLKLVADGKTSIEISDELQVSPFTIETHRRNLMQKLDVKNVAGLIKVAHEQKLLV